MGCKYPSFFPIEDFPSSTELYDPMLFSLHVDMLIHDLAEARKSLWEYINLHVKLKALEGELRKTLLRINTMEQSILPKLEKERRQIALHLSERERQEQSITKSWLKKKRLTGR